jgi:membrane-associated phospholipid phosphatase
VLISLLLTTVAGRVRAGESDYQYLPEWRNFAAFDYAATTAVLGAYLAFELSTDTPDSATWTKPLPLDRAARKLVVATTRNERTRMDHVSDVLWYSLVTYSATDAALVPLVRGWNFDASLQLTMMNVQSYAVASLLVRIPHKLLGRARPLDEGCQKDPAYSAQCSSAARFVSFPAGHAAISATAAGLVCAHHVFSELYASVTADAMACGVALLASSAVAVTRMRSDKHWSSDSVPALAVGLGAGFALPALVYYRGTPRRAVRAVPRDTADDSVLVLPFFSADTVGLRLVLGGA